MCSFHLVGNGVGKSEYLDQIAEMLLRHRWAAMATVDKSGTPAASMVAYAIDNERGVLYLHLSQLAAHTQEILHSGQLSLVISEADSGAGDPQQLARLSLNCDARVIERDSDEYASAKKCYLQRLPDAEQLFGFSDFQLFYLNITAARFVGGFARAHSYPGETISALLGS